MGLVPTDAVRITGLRELQASLKAIDGDAQKELRLVLNKAVDGLVDRARPLIPSLTGKARGSLKAQSSQREARVVAGGARVPYVPWLEFGGRVGRKKSIARPFLPNGRYLFPTFKKVYPDVVSAVADGVFGLIEKHGLDVKEGA